MFLCSHVCCIILVLVKPNRNHLADWFLLLSLLTTITHKHLEEHDLILHFVLSWQKQVLICSRYVDADSQRYSCTNVLQNYAANLHKVTTGAFRHKLNTCSFHYTTHCAALFLLTKRQKIITGCLNSPMILCYLWNQKY